MASRRFLVVDDCGIYYDASKPSALEKLVQDKAGNTALISRQRSDAHHRDRGFVEI